MKGKPINLAKDTLNGHYEMMCVVQKHHIKHIQMVFLLN